MTEGSHDTIERLIPERFRATILNKEWLIAQAGALQECFPEDWTPTDRLNVLVVGSRLHSCGIDWHSDTELTFVLLQLQSVGIMRMGWNTVNMGPHNGGILSRQFVKRGPLELHLAS